MSSRRHDGATTSVFCMVQITSGSAKLHLWFVTYELKQVPQQNFSFKVVPINATNGLKFFISLLFAN